jgi:hypothetical protein
MPLLEHTADLRNSGLTDQTISLMRCESVEVSASLIARGVRSAYRIPYLELKDCPYFYRDRLFPPIVDAKGHTQKYDQPKGTGCRLYVLEPVVDMLSDWTKPLFMVEGEKKAAAGYQAGLGCVVGVGGSWNFLDKSSGDLIPEFDRIAWHNREIFYIPDSDVWARKDLQDAVFEFGSKIRERGGLGFRFIQLPPGPDGAKRGLDDFLLTEGVEALMKLPKVGLVGAGWVSAKKALKVREKKREEKRVEAEAEVEEEKREEMPQELLANVPLTYDLIAAAAKLIQRFVFIKDQRRYLLIALWVLATYLFELFDYFPILWITSPTRRSGKTRLLEVLTQISSRPSGIQIEPSVATLYRKTHRGQTLILDEVEKLKNKDRDIHHAVMAILNSGFQRGAKVSRMEKNKDGKWFDHEYDTYGPKLIAGISNVSDTIADRSFVIKMIRRVRATEPLEKFRLKKLVKELGAFVMQLKIWAVVTTKLGLLQGIYDGMNEEPDELKDADDRFLDIVEPLLAIGLYADTEITNGAKSVRDELVALLVDMSNDRDETQGEAAILIAIDLIGKELGSETEKFIPSKELLEKFKVRPGVDWIKSTTGLAGFLSKLDLRPGHNPDKTKRGYTITRKWYEDIKNRYPSPFDADDPSNPSGMEETEEKTNA